MSSSLRSLLPPALAAAATLLGGAAAAQAPSTLPTPPPPAAPQVQNAAAPAAPEPLPRFGLMLDVGAPDGIGAAAVLRPLPWLRFNGGVLTNTVGVGLRAGASLVPFRTLVSPSLNLDVGHYFKADYSKLPQRFGASSDSAASILKDAGYNFGTASLGLEVGSQRGFSFFLRGGLSYWDFAPVNAEAALRDAADDPTLSVAPVKLRFGSPSLKLGFTLFL